MTGDVPRGERLLPVNGVELCAETFGDPADPAILLVAGGAASMLWWDAGLCARIAAAGRFVIRYDHRDTGRSTTYPPGRPGYSYTDLAADALGLLDALGVRRAHLVCQSMFGGLGLLAGLDHPDRVASLTFLSTSTGEDGLPPPLPRLAEQRPAAPDPADTAAVVDYVVASARAESGGSPFFDEDATRALVRHDVARARDYASTLANHVAIGFEPPSGRGFGDLTVPTLVVHGDRDPLFPPAHGEALRAAVPGAELVVLPGVGHAVVPPPAWDAFVAALVRHTGSGGS
ncbi:alpha/beta fold hydrolase [Prauserella flavalba]|uniref:Carboxylesterase n=1 Tax=Prauserella flavalba TaxID=1477506 RepID=A0A318M9S1_9PSEU|nr:alpha/beta fold hydrolase [Prauserella flavalba]PXY35559.1 carboxylesterase [Prauserella flavalba]